MSSPLFTSGTARGGTNLLVQILSVNKDVSLAADPFLPLFAQFRNALVRLSDDPEVREALDPDAPIDDYYFSSVKLRTLREIQKSSLDIAYDQSQRADLLSALDRRTALSSADLLPHLSQLTGDTFTQIFRNALDIIAKARNCYGSKWVGFNENWAVEFFQPLSRAFPDARFIIVLRDPRSAIASALRTPEKAQVPHVLSFAKCWRKYVAVAEHFKADPVIGERLFVLTYEDLVREPEEWTRKICDFLNVAFGPNMLDTDNFVTPDGAWQGNSHMGGPSSGIFTSSIDAWQPYLPTEIVETIEYLCDAEMRLLGYPHSEVSGEPSPSLDSIRFITKDCLESQGWRTDFGNVERDIGSEIFRKSLLLGTAGSVDHETVRRCFLFDEAYQALKRAMHPDRISDAARVAGGG